MLGIGRTPIREALQRLGHEGLVRVLPRKAIIVTDTDPNRQLLVLEVQLRARGRPANGEFEGGGETRASIRAVNALDFAEARNRFARGVQLTCNGASSGNRLKEVLAPYRSGRCPVSVVYSNRGASCKIDLGEAWRVNLHDDLIKSLSEWLSPENVRIVYGEGVTSDR